MAKRSRHRNNASAAGLVLAGGQSSRFGSEKAVALLANRPLLAWAAAALAGVCDRIAVSAAPLSHAETMARSMGLTVLADQPELARGPLAGVAAGMTWARGEGLGRLVTAPCDTPLLSANELSILLAALGDNPAAYAVTDEGPHPLCAVWRTDLIGMLGVRLSFGRHPAVRGFLADIEAVAVHFRDPAPFRNANTPEALTALAASLTPGR